MQFERRTLADVVLGAPAGRIDHPNAQALEHALRPILSDATAPEAALVLDFTGVDYISSMGLRVLMVAAKQLRARGKRIAVGGLAPAVQEIFAIARFEHVLEVFPTVRDALVAISAAALQAYDRAP